MKIETKKLTDGTLQIGYRTAQGWVGLTNLYRERGGWKSDNYPGWKRTITEWKELLGSN